MEKRGLSTVVTTVILVLLVLVAIGVVWQVIKTIVLNTKESTQGSLSKLKIDLQIKNINNDSGNLSIKLYRGVGEGDIVGIRFALSNSTDTKSLDRMGDFPELDEQTFSFNKAVDLGGIEYIEKVVIAPILKDDSGKQEIGNPVEKTGIGLALA